MYASNIHRIALLLFCYICFLEVTVDEVIAQMLVIFKFHHPNYYSCLNLIPTGCGAWDGSDLAFITGLYIY